MSYRLVADASGGGVIEVATGEHIKPGSTGWQRYQQWFAAGGRPEPAPDQAANLLALQDVVCSRINAERERRLVLPIVYAGALFDADAVAIRNIEAWQTQIAHGAVLPPGFRWWDFDNTDHPCDEAFINGLGLAMTIRGTLLMEAAKSHKAAVRAISDAETLAAYDYCSDSAWPA